MIGMIATMMVFTMSSGPRECDSAGMLSLLKRHEIQVLLAAGFSPSSVAERTGASTDTVVRVRDESPVAHVDDDAEHRRRRIGRPSKASRFGDAVKGWLEEEPDLPTQELLRRALAQGYSGRKSAFYGLVAANRPARGAPVVRFEGLPAEFTQHDFGQIDVRFVDESKKRVHFFASRLKYSRFVAVSIVANETTETLVRTLARHFVAFGGVPLLAVFDRPRTIVTKSGRGREVETFNATFAHVMLELGVGVEMCAARSGNQKGAVEQVVKWVKNSFFKWRKFADAQDLETQLAAWVHEVNVETPNRATKAIPETLRHEEAARLRPVRVLPENLALRVPIFVGPTAEAIFENVAYTMPPEAANVAGTAFVYERRIRFIAGRHQVDHERRAPSDARAALPEHRAAKLAAVHGDRARLYEMRQQLLHLGPSALTLLTHLVHLSPRAALGHVERLHALFDEHGERAMRAALDRVVSDATLEVAAVERALNAIRNAPPAEQLALRLRTRSDASDGGAR